VGIVTTGARHGLAGLLLTHTLRQRLKLSDRSKAGTLVVGKHKMTDVISEQLAGPELINVPPQRFNRCLAFEMALHADSVTPRRIKFGGIKFGGIDNCPAFRVCCSGSVASFAGDAGVGKGRHGVTVFRSLDRRLHSAEVATQATGESRQVHWDQAGVAVSRCHVPYVPVRVPVHGRFKQEPVHGQQINLPRAVPSQCNRATGACPAPWDRSVGRNLARPCHHPHKFGSGRLTCSAQNQRGSGCPGRARWHAPWKFSRTNRRWTNGRQRRPDFLRIRWSRDLPLGPKSELTKRLTPLETRLASLAGNRTSEIPVDFLKCTCIHGSLPHSDLQVGLPCGDSVPTANQRKQSCPNTSGTFAQRLFIFIDRTDQEQDVGAARDSIVSFLVRVRWRIRFFAHRFSGPAKFDPDRVNNRNGSMLTERVWPRRPPFGRHGARTLFSAGVGTILSTLHGALFRWTLNACLGFLRPFSGAPGPCLRVRL